MTFRCLIGTPTYSMGGLVAVVVTSLIFSLDYYLIFRWSCYCLKLSMSLLLIHILFVILTQALMDQSDDEIWQLFQTHLVVMWPMTSLRPHCYNRWRWKRGKRRWSEQKWTCKYSRCLVKSPHDTRHILSHFRV